uniref:Uncharacterized protein AlNc14C55G4223 n=1 Tax=Albugo laibachii Nc14 TaxID=890382 RepID=F0WC39_9STRA|nr:conserved hypothetical protein [Albugo laibachii Nc14]|eukprot:CCA18752.1 conserved hypothetical protein [Albugo laibachii Nc14]
MTDTDVKPTAILSALRMTKSDTFANLRTISNGRFNMRNEQLAGRAPLEAFLDNLQGSDWVHHVEANEVGNITGLFFAHPESIKLANHYNHVVVMDCTYKTSRYRMPLVHIIGMTAFNTTFTVGFYFLDMEKMENYLWEMSKLSTVWENGSAPKKQFVKAWTSKHSHFGNKSSSREERAHEFVKNFLQVSTGDLLLVFNKLNTALDHQIKAEVSQRSVEKMHHLVKIPEIFASVSGKISLFALKKCLVQHGKRKQELHPCTGIFTLELGIPWTHKLAAIIRNRGTLTAYNFHPQWQLDWTSTNGEKKDFGGQCKWELIRAHRNASRNKTREGDIGHREGARWSEHYCTIETTVGESAIPRKTFRRRNLPKISAKRDASFFEHR